MAKGKSRPKRWSEAVALIQEGHQMLTELQEEYQEWLDNLPENLQGSNLADKLEQVVGTDLESLESAKDDIEQAIGEIEMAIGEVEGVDLPLGFGRD